MMGGAVRLGFVGAGFMGQLAHLRHYAAIQECEVVALAEVRPRTGELVAARYGIPHLYDNVEQMLSEHELDGVIASQPFRRHTFMLPSLFARVPHVFSEKPSALSTSRAAELVTAAREAGAVHMVGYQKRCDPAVKAAHGLIRDWNESGRVGRLRYVRVTVGAGDWLTRSDVAHVDIGEPRPEDELEPFPEGLTAELEERHLDLVNFYVHQLNLIRFLLCEPYDVTYADPSGVLYAGRSASGVAIALEAQPYEPPGWYETVLVAFERGYLRVSLPPPLSWEAGHLEAFDGTELALPTIEQSPSFRKQAETFVAVCRGETAPPSDGADACLDLQLIDSIIARFKRQETPR